MPGGAPEQWDPRCRDCLTVLAKTKDKRDAWMGCAVLCLIPVALVGAAAFVIFLISLAWSAGKAVFS